MYVTLVHGRIVAPYCYGGNNRLTARYYDWRDAGDYWFARFEWFHPSEIKGFSFYRLTSEGRLEGRWWYDGEIPMETMNMDNVTADALVGGCVAVWERVAFPRIPKWAEEYFQKIQSKGTSGA